MKKLVTILLALIALAGGFYALVHFGGLNPSELLPKTSSKTTIHGTPSPEKLQELHDSLETINFVLRRETDERLRKNLMETQKNLWERISITRNALSKTEAPKTVKEEEGDLIDSLIKGISITAAILLTIIIFLIIKITRRSKEVEKVTERLRNLQTEPAPPPPLGGLDSTIFQTRFRPSPLPQVKPAEMQPEPEPEPEPEFKEQPKPTLRKTAKQRVTEAVKRMAEALESLRRYGTGKTRAVDSEGTISAGAIRVQSPNSTKVTPPPADETTYDRRAREKKQIMDYARQGRTPGEIAKWLGLPRDQVETVIRLARERGE
ncbi:MAG: helix-turn-helix domain containing protein [Fibromonadaceae bacterium]|nr:helix-turn-helix domain containing protein [Fibromonadaceae bacterium]